MHSAAAPHEPSAELPRKAPFPKRIGLAILMALIGVNVWTGSPLLALWIGSRFQGYGPPKMESVFVVAVLIAVLSFSLVQLLMRVGAAYERATGQSSTVRTHAPWLRSMRGERELYPHERPTLTTLERMLVIMVVLVVLLFEVWFFFFSASPIDQRTGRSEVPTFVASSPWR